MSLLQVDSSFLLSYSPNLLFWIASFDHFFSPKIYFGKTEALIRCKSSCVRNERNAREKKYLKIVSSVYSCVSTYDFKQFIASHIIVRMKWCSRRLLCRAKRKEQSYSARREKGDRTREEERERREEKNIPKRSASSTLVFRVYLLP